MQGVYQCATFVACTFMLVAVVDFAPFRFQIEALLNTVGCNGSIFVIISLFEFVDMIPFGLKLFAGQGGEVRAQIYVIGVIPVRCEVEPAGHESFQFGTHSGADTQQAKRLSLLIGILYQRVQHFV